ncbi:MAG: flagellar biosynthesis protein FlhB [Spirochaetia bacterium]|jgi:flagellar biosynthetic protein FlhB|nr:flagellar biosynthesis protein FlhB [Spirochaetia bacterium]
MTAESFKVQEFFNPDKTGSLGYPCIPVNSTVNNTPFIHLQWFAPEDEGRTEDPTEHKLRKAREDGKVAKSSEFAPAVVLVFTVTALAFLSKYMLDNLIDMMKYFFTISSSADITSNSRILPAFFSYFFKMFLPVAVIAFIAALAGNLIQVGFLFSTKPITPDFNRIAPDFVRYFKRAVFSMEAVFNFAKTIFKILVIVVVVVLNLKLESDKLLNLSGQTVLFSMGYIAKISFRLLIEASFALIVLSLPDYMFQRKQHRESLKMSKQEIKEEMKQLEGDPKIKNMLMERMRELMSQNISKNVPLSDVIVTNPTHYSIAIMYDRYTMNAPSVSAKGKDEIALRIREIAKNSAVPIMENKPLARALYSEVEVGQEIPVKYWETVSIILSEVYKLSGKAV